MSKSTPCSRPGTPPPHNCETAVGQCQRQNPDRAPADSQPIPGTIFCDIYRLGRGEPLDTDGCSSTSGTGLNPSGIPNAASRAAAHNSAFARARVGGAAAAATCRESTPPAAAPTPAASTRRIRPHQRRPYNISTGENARDGVPGCENRSVSPTPAQQARAARIAVGLASTGFALPGTLTERMTRCGHPTTCRCHADPPRLHGPYHQWTRRSAQDRHPHPHRRPARRLPALVRQPAAAPRPGRRAGNPQPGNRRQRPPVGPLTDSAARRVGTARL